MKTKMKTKRLFAAAMCAMLLMTLLPTTTLAAGTAAIQLGAGGIAKGDQVYFGQYGGEEVPWIALDDGGFLLSQYTIGSVRFRDCRYYYQAPGPQNPGYYGEDWDYNVEDSQLKLTMEGLYDGAGTTLLTASEQGAVAATVLTAESMDYDGYVRPLTVRLYPLSIMEIYDYSARKYIIDEALLVTGDITDKLHGNRYGWWTRTNDTATGVVRVGGRDTASPVQDEIRDSSAIRGVRPAFHLHRDAVLFASAAVSGKSANGMGSGLTEVPDGTPAAWKLTLLESGAGSGREAFDIMTVALSTTSATVDYVGAKTGANEYISAMIVENGSARYYGRVKSLSAAADASGTVTVHIPSGITLDANTQLLVFNEQFNGDRTANAMTDASRAYTDYASAFKAVTPPPVVSTPTFSPAAGSYQNTQNVILFCATAGATIRYTLDGTDPSEASPAFVAGTPIEVSSTTTLQAKAFKTYMAPSAVASATFTIRNTTSLTVTLSGSTSYPLGDAAGNAVFTVTSNDGSLNASDHYRGATLDGQAIDLGQPNGAPGADGSLADGSLIATLRPAKLNTLAVGNHTLALTLGGAFAGRTVTGVITVTPAAVPPSFAAPKTGDSMPLAMLPPLAFLSLGGVAWLLMRRRLWKR